jgi:hypothetical protein
MLSGSIFESSEPVQFLRMGTVFLFGAGASYGSCDCTPYCPPLGTKLFSELQGRGGVAAEVTGALRDKFENDFERGMEEFFRYRNTETTAFLREMADYFAQFEPGPKNYYVELARIVAQAKSSVVLATTNYEMLLELAVKRAGYNIVYDKPPYYPKGGIPVLKLHGSCNFLPDFQGGGLRGIGFDVLRKFRTWP